MFFSHTDFSRGITIITPQDANFKDYRNEFSPQAEQEACRVQRRVFEKDGQRNKADQLFVREMRVRRQQKIGRKKIEAFFEWLLADVTSKYGTSIPRLTSTFLSLSLILFPLGYLFGNLIGWGMIVKPTGNPVVGFELVYYSLMTFLSILYRGMYPEGWYMKICSLLEAFLGMVYIALIIALLTRKWMR